MVESEVARGYGALARKKSPTIFRKHVDDMAELFLFFGQRQARLRWNDLYNIPLFNFKTNILYLRRFSHLECLVVRFYHLHGQVYLKRTPAVCRAGAVVQEGRGGEVKFAKPVA